MRSRYYIYKNREEAMQLLEVLASQGAKWSSGAKINSNYTRNKISEGKQVGIILVTRLNNVYSSGFSSVDRAEIFLRMDNVRIHYAAEEVKQRFKGI